MEQKLHTPEGVRDIYNKECAVKLALQNRLTDVFHLYGYQDIQTPMFEYYDVFRKEIGSTSTQELYKFFDREGNILALRPDLTPSIARAAATLFETEDLPIRLCYCGNTFINHSSYLGRLRENTQLGVEMINVDSVEADAEMIALVVDGLKKTGLQEFQVSIGHVDFIQSLLEMTGLKEEDLDEIRTLIVNRNYFGVEEVLEHKKISGKIRDAFRVLPELVGGAEVLDQASHLELGKVAKAGIARLQQIYALLEQYGAQKHVTFDLSMSGSYGYYTGVIFRAYTYGTGDAVVRGGRYDHLLEKFGKSTPSIGFAVILDELMKALGRQKIQVETGSHNLIVYTDATSQLALSLACSFREKNRAIEMIKREDDEDRERYVAYARRTSVASMLYIREDSKIEMLNLRTGEEKLVDARKN